MTTGSDGPPSVSGECFTGSQRPFHSSDVPEVRAAEFVGSSPTPEIRQGGARIVDGRAPSFPADLHWKASRASLRRSLPSLSEATVRAQAQETELQRLPFRPG